MFVMGGAVLFNLLAFPAILSRSKPALAESFYLPTKVRIYIGNIKATKE
jgi:hypothetical protein